MQTQHSPVAAMLAALQQFPASRAPEHRAIAASRSNSELAHRAGRLMDELGAANERMRAIASDTDTEVGARIRMQALRDSETLSRLFACVEELLARADGDEALAV